MTLNWRRTVTTALAFATVVAAVAAIVAVFPIVRRACREHRENAIAPIAASDDEFREVVLAVLAHDRFPKTPGDDFMDGTGDGPKRPILLDDESIVICRAHEFDEPAPDGCTAMMSDDFFVSPYNDARSPVRLRRELGELNRRGSKLPTITVPWIRMTSHALVRAAADASSGEALRQLLDDTAGLVEISRVALSADRSHALVYVSYHRGPMSGGSAMYYLARGPTGWKVEFRDQIMVS